jgi:exosortase A
VNNDGTLPAVGDRSVSACARALLWVAVPCVLVLLMYWSTAADLASLWASTEDYGHGYLLAPLTVFLIWRRRQEMAREPLVPCLWASVLTVGTSVIWVLAALVGLQVVMQLALLGVLLMVLWTVLGWPRFRWVALPIAYLIFAIPVWSITVPIMQGWTADVATQGVRWLGIPVFREGPFLTIPGGRFEIAQVCAGLRFLMASMSLVALYGYLNFDQPMRRVAFFVLGVVWAVFFNWVRVVVVIWLGHTLGMDAAIVQDHNSVGWGLFAGSLVPLFIITCSRSITRRPTMRPKTQRPRKGLPKATILSSQQSTETVFK